MNIDRNECLEFIEKFRKYNDISIRDLGHLKIVGGGETLNPVSYNAECKIISDELLRLSLKSNEKINIYLTPQVYIDDQLDQLFQYLDNEPIIRKIPNNELEKIYNQHLLNYVKINGLTFQRYKYSLYTILNSTIDYFEVLECKKRDICNRDISIMMIWWLGTHTYYKYEFQIILCLIDDDYYIGCKHNLIIEFEELLNASQDGQVMASSGHFEILRCMKIDYII